jgi:hypothetical protein
MYPKSSSSAQFGKSTVDLAAEWLRLMPIVAEEVKIEVSFSSFWSITINSKWVVHPGDDSGVQQRVSLPRRTSRCVSRYSDSPASSHLTFCSFKLSSSYGAVGM